MTEYDMVCNKAAARGWVMHPISNPAVSFFHKSNMMVKVAFTDRIVYDAVLYRSPDNAKYSPVDKVANDTEDNKVASVMYLLETI